MVAIDLPPLAALIPDPSILPIDNEVDHTDIKFDVWVTPFLNVFAVYGQLDGSTVIDLSVLGLPLPVETNHLTVDYDGDVYGAGLVLAVGGDRWFASLTGTFTETSLDMVKIEVDRP